VFGGRPGIAGKGLHTVDYDNESGARMAVEHLLSLGHRRIVTVCGPQDHPAAVDRLAGWRETLVASGIDPDGMAESGDFTQHGGEAAMARLLERVPDLDAVFAASDPMAVGAMRALKSAGLRVPEDVSIVGFDDNPRLAPTLNPPLTSVHQDPGEQVGEMISMLMSLLSGEQLRVKRRVLPVSLTLRQSTA
jgi:DNA-binding LacI/PurR family transcriptional regulator